MKDENEAVLAKECGNRIRELRNKLGWSQPELAQFLDCNTETVSKAERGLHMMKSWRLAKLCRRCGVSMDYMILGTDPYDTTGVPARVIEAYRKADREEKAILSSHLELAVETISMLHDREKRLKAYLEYEPDPHRAAQVAESKSRYNHMT